jgi:predicted RNA-binding Zn-ribbon protein involved in translation (DUF1610 family)
MVRYDRSIILPYAQSLYNSAEPSQPIGDVGLPPAGGSANEEAPPLTAPVATDVSSPQLSIYRVFFSVGQNARIADEQDVLTQQAPFELVRTVREGPAIARRIETFACPSCGRTYSINVNGPNVDFRCVKCGNLMLIVSRAW